MEKRTLEQAIKFDNGLEIGVHCVLLTYKGNQRKALIEIGNRGKVKLLTEPREEDMYSCWCTVKGNMTKNDGAIIVWGARDPSLMAVFDVPTVATIELPDPE